MVSTYKLCNICKGKGVKSDLHLLQAQQALYYLFDVTNGKKEKKISLVASARLSFPVIYGQRTMTNEGGKRKHPAPTASTAESAERRCQCQKIQFL